MQTFQLDDIAHRQAAAAVPGGQGIIEDGKHLLQNRICPPPLVRWQRFRTLDLAVKNGQVVFRRHRSLEGLLGIVHLHVEAEIYQGRKRGLKNGDMYFFLLIHLKFLQIIPC